MELVVSTERSTVKAEVVACARGLYDVTFVPHEAVSHFVNISFNEEDVPGSPFRCDVLDVGNKDRLGMKKEERTISVKGEGPREIVVGQKAFYDVDVIGVTGHVDMEVLGIFNLILHTGHTVELKTRLTLFLKLYFRC